MAPIQWVHTASSCRAGSFSSTLEIPHDGLSVSSPVYLSEDTSPVSGTSLVEAAPNVLLYSKEVLIHKSSRKKTNKQQKSPSSLSARSVSALISTEILLVQAEV